MAAEIFDGLILREEAKQAKDLLFWLRESGK